jgi:hypothetical protein
MELDIPERRRKTKIIGIRLYPEEYKLISSVAREKDASRSFVAESLIRVALVELKLHKPRKRGPRSHLT